MKRKNLSGVSDPIPSSEEDKKIRIKQVQAKVKIKTEGKLNLSQMLIDMLRAEAKHE